MKILAAAGGDTTALTAADGLYLDACLKLALLGPEYYGSWGRNQKQLKPIIEAARKQV